MSSLSCCAIFTILTLYFVHISCSYINVYISILYFVYISYFILLCSVRISHNGYTFIQYILQLISIKTC